MLFFMFSVIVFRYFLIAGSFYFFFYMFSPEKWKTRRVNLHSHHSKQFKKELKWSLISAMIFALAGAITAVAWKKGYTAFYDEISEYGWIYFFSSMFIVMFIHETYYYWLHRAMHHPKIYKHIHKTHHDSVTPSPWTAFSFHPAEAFLEALILPLILFFIPVHYYVLLTYLILMTLSSVVNHLNIEIYPYGFEKHWLGKWLIGATHHSLHHSQFRYNFGLYFTFWDKLAKTECPDFKKLFRQKSSQIS
ncbi:MAG: sterol desaturase family protein [Cytophagaceae bacterium]|nr:sterol desaturase family protein [Cytophagaceae bacterium]